MRCMMVGFILTLGFVLAQPSKAEHWLDTGIMPGTELDPSLCVSGSPVWYSSKMCSLFSDNIELFGLTYDLGNLPCLPDDITEFNFSVRKVSGRFPALEVDGSIRVGSIPRPFEASEYLLGISAYLICNDEIIWSQEGYPIGGDWLASEGGTCEFHIVSGFQGNHQGCTLLLIASGDPIYTPSPLLTRVVIGVGQQEL